MIPNPPPPDSADAPYEAFVRQFVASEPRLRAFLRSLLPRWDDVDDVLQETSVVAWRKFGQFEAGSSFTNWVFSIGRFEALKHLRHRVRSPLVFSDEVWELLAEEASEEVERLEAERRALAHCLERLEPAQRELLEKSYQPGARFHQVAAQAGRSATAFYKVVQRLRAALLDCIERRLRQEGAA
jgi:RNA polymerase sigma-70 factor (ECF subfamily)